MCHSVIVEVAAGCKSLPADPALVRLLPAVDPPVRVQTGAGGETLLANIADVRPLAGVGPQMAVEQRRTVEAFPAKLARQHLLGLPLVAAPDRGDTVVII